MTRLGSPRRPTLAAASSCSGHAPRPRHRRLPHLALLTLAIAACRPGRGRESLPPDVPPAAADAGPTPARAAVSHDDPDFTARVRIFARSGEEVSLSEALDALAKHRFVMFGETHLDETTHQLEHAVLRGLASRTGDAVTLSMEMFQRDVQDTLDAYLAGSIDEAKFLGESKPWGNYRTGYRRLVEEAKVRGLPVVGANLPRQHSMTLSRGAAESYEKVRAEHPGEVPREMFDASDEYWARIDRTLRGHGPMGGGGGDRLYSIQSYWDNIMAESCVDAAAQRPEHVVMHVAGSFHIAYDEGTTAQVRKRTEQSVGTIVAVPVSDLAEVEPDPARADFVAYVRADASGAQNGKLSVTVPATLRYRLAPEPIAAATEPLPLVVWLPDAGARPQDEQQRLARLLGKGVALIVVEPPLRQQGAHGWLERRWSFPGSFGGDVSTTTMGLHRIVAYATRNLPIDAGRIVIAGEGEGAAVALWTALYDDETKARVVAIDPPRLHALRTASIPENNSAITEVTILDDAPGDDALKEIVANLRETKTRAKALKRHAQGSARARDALDVLLDVLGEPTPAGLTDEGGAALWVPAPEDADAVAHRWLRLVAERIDLDTEGIEVEVGTPPKGAKAIDLSTAGLAKLFAREGARLPRPPATFFSGTVLVLPPGTRKTDPAAKAAWEDTVAKAAERRGRFAKLHLVDGDDAGALAATLRELSDQGVRDILIAPVAFAASEDAMQSLMASVGELPDAVSLHWLPGLGASAAAALDPAAVESLTREAPAPPRARRRR